MTPRPSHTARQGLAGVMEACRSGFDAATDKLNIRHRDFGIVRIPMVRSEKHPA